MTACRRTAGILDHLLDERPLSTADLRHLRECPDCGPAADRLPAFSGALRFATRNLVTEPIPAAVLTVEALDAPRQASPRLLFGAAGLAIVLATGLMFAVFRSGPGPAAGIRPPVLAGELRVATDLQSAGYRCAELTVDPKRSSVIEGTMCHPIGAGAPLKAAIVVELDLDGDVRELIAKASPDNPRDPEDAQGVLAVVTTAVRVGVSDPGTRSDIEAWVAANAGRLSRGEAGLRMFGPLIVELQRFDNDGLGLQITELSQP